MAFSDIAIKTASEAAIFGLQKHLGKFEAFAHNFSPTGDKQYSGVAVPCYDLSAAADFVSGTNDWSNGDTLDGKVINLEKHYVKVISLPDTGIGENTTGNGEVQLNFVQDGTKAIVDVLGTAVNKYVFGLFTATNISASYDLSAIEQEGSAGFAGLMKVCDDNGFDPYETTLVLNPETYGKLLNTLDASVYSTGEAIKEGKVDGLYSFKSVIMASYLPNGVKGALVPNGSFGVVTRVNKPTVNGYANAWTIAADNNVAIGMRVYEDLAAGACKLGGDILVGAKFLNNKAVRLT